MPISTRDEYVGLLARLGLATLSALKAAPKETVVPLFYAMVLDTTAPCKSLKAGGDWFCTISLIDPTVDTSDAMKIPYFTPSRDLLPHLRAGDVVKCLNVKISYWNGKYQGGLHRVQRRIVTSIQAIHAPLRDDSAANSENVPPPAQDLLPERPRASPLDEPLLAMAIRQLCLGANQIPGQPLNQRSQRPLVTMADIRPKCAPFNMVVRIVHVGEKQGSTRNILVTDYTENDQLGDTEYSIFSRYSMRPKTVAPCTLWDAHASAVVHNQDYVYLKYVTAKTNQKTGLLELKLSGDLKYPQKINIKIIDASDPVLHDLLKREREFRLDHIEALYADKAIGQPTTPLAQVKVCPIVPSTFLCRVSVVDFLPQELVNFVTGTCRDCNSLCSYEGCQNLACSSTRIPAWKFRFALLVKDDTDCVPIVMQNEDAEAFLGLEPTNLKQNQKHLHQLEARLSRMFKFKPCNPDVPHHPLRKVYDPESMSCWIQSYQGNDQDGRPRVRYRFVNTQIAWNPDDFLGF
ncbi:hypothetical protein SeMB42_g05649 [Synchytrium endobioticum]|uniref:Protection of telomeres protein 1 n=1 Tax=Synchytrium endobioticum TaxID=286115 RepID=A0A507CQ44_9FUNG|nr:hypothetical protein SeMB42_g05649 [Synchytrium endobioticum]TPX44732.1 hypothetical protein SeLEV6574_g04317 [Synchytrium endobioticum]